MPTNLYRTNDNYDLEKKRGLPALFRKFITAARINDVVATIWGPETPKRDLLHVDDMTDTCLYLMKEYNEKRLVNIATGMDMTILQLAKTIKKISSFQLEAVLDKTKRDGMYRKLLDVSKLAAIGWRSKIDLKEGIKMVYTEMKNHE